jgi:putative transposase
MMRIRIGDQLAFTDATYEVVEHFGRRLKLRDLDTGKYINIASSEVSGRLLVPDRYVPPRAADLDQAPDDALAAARIWAVHIEQMDPGIADRAVHDVNSDPRYDPRLSLGQRMRNKVLELESQGVLTSVGSLKRKRIAYMKEGLSGLIDRRKTRTESPIGRADPRIVEALCRVMAREKNSSTGTGSRIIMRLQEEVLRSYPGQAIELPSSASLYRYIDILGKGKYPTGKATSRRSVEKVPKRMFGHRYRDRPGSEVQMDSSPLDMLVRDEDGNVDRPVLCIMVDVATRSIISSGIRLGANKGVDLAVVLARCLVPKDMRPGPDCASTGVEARDLQEEISRRRREGEMPYIVPERIVIDNGADYRSTVFVDACKHFGISVTFSAPGTPTDKPIVENTFNSINTLFAQHMPGYLGGNVSDRGLHIEKTDLLDLRTLIGLFEEWVQTSWQVRPHDSLRDPLYPDQKLSPNEMYDAMFDVAGEIAIPLTSSDYIALMPALRRAIGRRGITINHRRYDSKELNPLRLKPSPQPRHGDRWEVRYSPYDPSAVWVKHPETGKWIECIRKDINARLRPFASDVARQSRHMVEVRAEDGTKAAAAATRRLIRKADQTARANAKAERRRLLAVAEEMRSGVPRPEPAVMPELDTDSTESGQDHPEAEAVIEFHLGGFNPEDTPY